MAEPEKAVGPVPLVPSAHKGLRIKEIGNANHIATHHFARIYAPEFVKAGADYPIIFVKDPTSGDFFAAVMWGIDVGENLFVEDGVWKGGYFPASVRCYPFAVQPDPEDPERLFIGIHETAEILSKEEGNLLFNDDETETKWMTEVKEFLVRVYQQDVMTRQFIKELDELGLLVSQTLSIKNNTNDGAQDVSGFYVVDREKLLKLDDDKYLGLRKTGALEVIYSHIMSLETLDKLLRQKSISTMPTSPKPEAE